MIQKQRNFLFCLLALCTAMLPHTLTSEPNDYFSALQDPTEHPVSTTAPDQNNQRAVPHSTLSKKELRAVQKERAKDAKNNRLRNSAPGVTQETLKPRCVYGFYCPFNANHFLPSTPHQGLDVEIENGAVFSVSIGDKSTVQRWKERDIVTLTPNSSWFSHYELRLYNQRTKDSAAVKLSLGPYMTSEWTRQITYFDKYNGEIGLNDGSYWKISMTQVNMTLIQPWNIGDVIIFGTNDSWFSWGYTFFLLNSNHNTYVTCKHIR